MFVCFHLREHFYPEFPIFNCLCETVLKKKLGWHFFSSHTMRKPIGKSVDLLELSLKIKFGLYRRRFLSFSNFSPMCHLFSSATEAFSRDNATKRTNFLDKDNTTWKHYNMAGLQLFRQKIFTKATIPIGIMGNNSSEMFD